jgi:hypothetical protein
MYLGLTGLVALMVGGVGVAVSVRAFVRQKLDAIAILKSLGAGWRQILAAYVCQTALLGLGGSLLGAALGSGVQPLLAPVLARLLPFPVDLAVSPLAVLKGMALGLRRCAAGARGWPWARSPPGWRRWRCGRRARGRSAGCSSAGWPRPSRPWGSAPGGSWPPRARAGPARSCGDRASPTSGVRAARRAPCWSRWASPSC